MRRTATRAAAAALLCLLAGGLAAPAPATAATTAQRLVSIARGELAKGVREVPDGSNRGARIQHYGQSTSPRFYPAPWCAYFVSWVARQAGTPLGPSGAGFGYVPYLRAWAQRTGRWERKPRSGDLVMFAQHVGLVETVSRNGTLTTIEGNSSSRVARRFRRWSEASGYVRFAGGGHVGGPAPSPRPAPKRPGHQPLTARISVYPGATVAAGQKVGFSANDSSGQITTYRWDLDGDGRFDDARGDNAERTYRTARKVEVGLSIRGAGRRTKTTRRIIEVHHNRAPEAKVVLPRSAPLGERVVAHGEDSRDPDGDIVRFEWDMDGDGVYAVGGDHGELAYTRPGVFTVGLRVTDDLGATTEAVGTVAITQEAPTAKGSGPSKVGLGALAQFDGSRSRDPDDAIAGWSWDFDGDGVDDAEGVRPAYRFAVPGRRVVTLTVRDAWGATATTQLAVEVTNASPTAVILKPAQAVAGTELTFDGTGSDDPDSTIARYDWDFTGDGVTDATGPVVRWTWTGTGTRHARLTVTDAWGAQRSTRVAAPLLQRPVIAPALLTTAPTARSPVTFHGGSTHDPDGAIVRLEWDFTSDGTIDAVTGRTSATVATTYASAGSYLVRVTAVDDHGLRTTTQLPVTVRPAAA